MKNQQRCLHFNKDKKDFLIVFKMDETLSKALLTYVLQIETSTQKVYVRLKKFSTLQKITFHSIPFGRANTFQ